MEIATNPEAYARYLSMQGDNPMYSAGNIALAMIQDPQATMFATTDRWRTLGRNVAEMEKSSGIQIFARSPLGKGYTLTNAYDITQTTGRDVKRTELKNGTPGMETALATLLNYSVVPVVVDNDLPTPAFYDSQSMELAIQPNYPDNEAFAAIATEIALARFHNKGANTGYNREECTLDAESVSYILCRRFGIDRNPPDLSNLGDLYEGWDAQDVRQALSSIQEMSKQHGRCTGAFRKHHSTGQYHLQANEYHSRRKVMCPNSGRISSEKTGNSTNTTDYSIIMV